MKKSYITNQLALSTADEFDLHLLNFHLDLQGWNSDSPIFHELINRVRPEIIIEVGTWKGASAIRMANILKQLDINAYIVCVDTWLGALEFWLDKNDKDRYLSLNLSYGYPSVYYQFLANTKIAEVDDMIVPFPQTSTIAARYFIKKSVVADLIYIDASHDFKDVQEDILAYSGILSDRGVMFGDDYRTWESVRDAVNVTWKILQPSGWALELAGNHWVLHK